MATKPSLLFLSHAAFSRLAQEKPQLSKTVTSYCSSKKKAKPIVASHSEGRQNYSNINTTYLALSVSQSFWSTRILQCRKKKKRLSGHKERNAVKAGRPWQLDEASRLTVNNQKHREKRLTSQTGHMESWIYGQNRKTNWLSKENSE